MSQTKIHTLYIYAQTLHQYRDYVCHWIHFIIDMKIDIGQRITGKLARPNLIIISP